MKKGGLGRGLDSLIGSKRKARPKSEQNRVENTQTSKEALHYCVIPAITLSAHTLSDTICAAIINISLR